MDIRQAVNLQNVMCSDLKNKRNPVHVTQIGNGEFVCKLYGYVFIWSVEDWNEYFKSKSISLTGGDYEYVTDIELAVKAVESIVDCELYGDVAVNEARSYLPAPRKTKERKQRKTPDGKVKNIGGRLGGRR